MNPSDPDRGGRERRRTTRAALDEVDQRGPFDSRPEHRGQLRTRFDSTGTSSYQRCAARARSGPSPTCSPSDVQKNSSSQRSCSTARLTSAGEAARQERFINMRLGNHSLRSVKSSKKGKSAARAIKVGAVASAAAIALTACGSAKTASSATKSSTSTASSKPVTITFWSPGLSEAANVALFNKTHPDIHVVYTDTPGAKATYAKMEDAIKAGNPPDVGSIEYDELPQFVRTGGILDIAKYGANKYENDFMKSIWQQVDFGGGTWAIPRNTAPVALFYNAKLFAKYGLAVPTTWAQFASEAESLHAAHPGVYLSSFNTSTSWYSMLAWQAGAVWYKPDGNEWKLGFTSAASEKVASYWQHLISAHAVDVESPYTPAFAKQLNDGDLLSYPGPEWLSASIASQAPATSGDWKIAPFPQWSAEGHAYGQWGGSSLAVFKDSKHPRAALTFAMWLVTNHTSVSTLIGGYPAAKSGETISALSVKMPFFSNESGASIFRTAQNDTLSGWSFGPDWGVTKTEGDDDLEAVASGSSTMTQWLSELQSQQLSELKSIGLKATS